MSESIRTLSMQKLVLRFQLGDKAGFDELVRRTQESLDKRARSMLRKYPLVSGREEAEDVLQNALRKLSNALAEITPNSIREFYGLANEQIRRTLLDFTRYYRKRQRIDQQMPQAGTGSDVGELDPIDPEDSKQGVELWEQLHEAVSGLPPLEREVFSLTFYHGWTQHEIAEVLGYKSANGDRQVRRVLKEAYQLLRNTIGGDPPLD